MILNMDYYTFEFYQDKTIICKKAEDLKEN